jgi:hypothetical protein
MARKHQKTLAAIFAKPIRANIFWDDVISLFRALGAEVTQGRGSRVRVVLNGRRSTFHEPHPEREIGKKTVADVREFLEDAGFAP